VSAVNPISYVIWRKVGHHGDMQKVKCMQDKKYKMDLRKLNTGLHMTEARNVKKLQCCDQIVREDGGDPFTDSIIKKLKKIENNI